MRIRLLLLCVGLLLALSACGVEDDFKYMKEREQILSLKAQGKRMPFTKNCELYNGVAFYNNEARDGYATWFVRDGKVYALNESAQEITPNAIPTRIPSIWEAFLPGKINATLASPPQLPPNLGIEAYEFHKGLTSALHNINASVSANPLMGGVTVEEQKRASYIVKEEGGYITHIIILLNNSADKNRPEGYNQATSALLSYILLQFAPDKAEQNRLAKELLLPVYEGKKEKSSFTNGKIFLEFSILSDYRKAAPSEIPEELKAISKPLIFGLEIKVAEQQ